jgi:MFS family permease
MKAAPVPPRRSSLGILFLIVFTDLLGFGIVIPLLPRYGETLGASPAQLGALLASYSLLQFVFSPVWGRLSDRFGRKPILVLSLVGSVIGYTLFAAAQTIPLLIIARAFAGMMAANISTAQAYIADVTPPESRAKGMGVVGAAFGLGFSLGPFAGGGLAALQGSAAFAPARGWPLLGELFSNPQGLPGLFAALLSATALLLAIVLLPESLVGKAPARIRTSRLRLIWEAVNRPNVGVVYSIFRDREDNLWVGFQSNGLARLRTKQLFTISTVNGLTNDSTRSVFQDRSGTLWIGTVNGFGGYRNGNVATYQSVNGSSIGSVKSIGEDKEGNLWIGAEQELLILSHGTLLKRSGWNSSSEVRAIYRDQQGHMWVGTDGDGLFEFTDLSGEFKHYTVKDGLPSNQVRTLLVDRKGALWIGTQPVGVTVWLYDIDTFAVHRKHAATRGKSITGECL